MYGYRVFNLRIASGIPIPEFSGVEAPPDGEADLSIRQAGLAPELAGALKCGVCYQAGRNALQINVPGVARYLSLEGRDIMVDPEPDAPLDTVRSFLLDGPLTGILHQRGLLPLYGCGVKLGDECALICGISGKGKSTVAQELMARGYSINTDDLAVVEEHGGRLRVLPGYPSQRLPLDTLQRLGLAADDYPPVRPGISQRRVAVPDESWWGGALPLKKVIILTTWNRSGCELKEPEPDRVKFNLLHDAMHRQYLSGMGGGFALVKITAALMNQTPAIQVLHSREVKDISEMIDRLEEEMAK
jgi:hypothetical protein